MNSEVTPTMGSLFSGFGGFELPAEWHGAKVLWQSEIEPWPVRLLAHRFPDAMQLGDITKINGAEIPPVDFITFGSPCQDMSVAGKREGIEGSRSVLFYEATRIIKEMREATNGEYPHFAIWENVPGSLTSHKGHDFQAVLEEITEATIPMPNTGRWADAGMVRGGAADISWRILDAQYWGVPQRRKRVILVADYKTGCSAEILFVPEGLSRHPSQGRKQGQGTAGASACNIGEAVKSCGMRIATFYPQMKAESQCYNENEVSNTLVNGINPGFQNGVILPSVCLTNRGHFRTDGKSEVIRSECGGDFPLIVVPLTDNSPRIIMLQDKIIGRKESNTSNGLGVTEEGPCYTLTSTDVHGVVAPVLVLNERQYALTVGEDAEIIIGELAAYIEYIVRRLMPGECAELQGFPFDWHEGVKDEKGNEMKDSPAYKGYGNAVATVVAEYPIANIIQILRKEHDYNAGFNGQGN